MASSLPFSHKQTVASYRAAYGRYPHVGVIPPKKSVSRAIQRQVEFQAGKDEALRGRARRLSLAESRLQKTGNTVPSNTRSPRGAETVFSRENKNPNKVTVGHPGVRSFIQNAMNKDAAELTTEGSTAPQSARSNYGVHGQGADTITSWKRRLASKGFGVYPNNPLELDTNKTRVAARETPMYGPAPRIGRAAGFTGRLPSVLGALGPMQGIADFVMANATNKPYSLNDFMTTVLGLTGAGDMQPVKDPNGNTISRAEFVNKYGYDPLGSSGPMG
jgi:hypothetical protein